MNYSLQSSSYSTDNSPQSNSDGFRFARPQLVGTGARGEAAQSTPLLIGRSSEIQNVIHDIDLVANRACTVLIEGETGTGKEVVARSIHGSGARRKGPWVAVNCGAIPEAMLEAELFGHVRGAFTGAIQSRAGKFEAANRGTIFLDEITEMPVGVQAKLLRVLQERELERVGANERIRLDVRVIAATNAGLAERVRKGLFREDLFYRLNVFRISVPPLRARVRDILVLAEHFLDKVSRAEGSAPKVLGDDAVNKLIAHHWPGNVRELENIIEAATIVSGNRTVITADDVRICPSPGTSANESPSVLAAHFASGHFDFQKAVESFEERLLTDALLRVRGNKTAAAELLGLKRTTLAAKMRVLGSRAPRLVA